MQQGAHKKNLLTFLELRVDVATGERTLLFYSLCIQVL